MPPYPLTNSERQRYYKYEPRFNSVYSRDNSPNTIKDGTYVINLDVYSDIGTYCMLCTRTVIRKDILTVLVLNTFQKKSKHL